MNIRHDDEDHVTYYGDGPLIDRGGYAVEVASEDGTNLCRVRVSTSPDSGPRLRADLTAAQVDDLTDRLIAAREHLKDTK